MSLCFRLENPVERCVPYCQLGVLRSDVKIYSQGSVIYFQIIDSVFHPSVLGNYQ